MNREAILSQLIYEEERLWRMRTNRGRASVFSPRNQRREQLVRERIASLEAMLDKTEKKA